MWMESRFICAFVNLKDDEWQMENNRWNYCGEEKFVDTHGHKMNTDEKMITWMIDVRHLKLCACKLNSREFFYAFTNRFREFDTDVWRFQEGITNTKCKKKLRLSFNDALKNNEQSTSRGNLIVVLAIDS